MQKEKRNITLTTTNHKLVLEVKVRGFAPFHSSTLPWICSPLHFTPCVLNWEVLKCKLGKRKGTFVHVSKLAETSPALPPFQSYTQTDSQKLIALSKLCWSELKINFKIEMGELANVCLNQTHACLNPPLHSLKTARRLIQVVKNVKWSWTCLPCPSPALPPLR